MATRYKITILLYLLVFCTGNAQAITTRLSSTCISLRSVYGACSRILINDRRATTHGTSFLITTQLSFSPYPNLDHQAPQSTPHPRPQAPSRLRALSTLFSPNPSPRSARHTSTHKSIKMYRQSQIHLGRSSHYRTAYVRHGYHANHDNGPEAGRCV